MTLQQLIQTYNGKFLEKVDGANKNQCMDLVVAYIEDVLGYPRLTNGIFYAYQIFTNPTQGLKDNFEIIANTPTGVPQAGDIVVWSNQYGFAGHTAVIVEADVNAFKAFSQNDPVGSPCVLKIYGYNKVLGWLRKKKQDPLTECLNQHLVLVKKTEEQDKKIKELQATEERLKEEKDLLRVDYENKLKIERDRFATLRVTLLVEFKQKAITKLQEIS